MGASSDAAGEGGTSTAEAPEGHQQQQGQQLASQQSMLRVSSTFRAASTEYCSSTGGRSSASTGCM